MKKSALKKEILMKGAKLFLVILCSGSPCLPGFASNAGGVSDVESLLGVEPSEVDKAVQYTVPGDWSKMRQGTAEDPAIVLTNWPYHIKIELFGGKGSRHASPEAFLESLEARAAEGETGPVASVTVSGVPVTMYRRSVRVRPPTLEDPYVVPVGEPRIGEEEFCILPVGERFFVLRYGNRDYHARPEDDEAGKKIWRAFLASFRIRK